jgi:DNA (cytosine-5)-methyltransferase 1
MNGNYTNFYNWLISVKTLTENSAGDVISRIKRAKNIMDIDVPIDTELLLFHFMGKPDFKALTTTVKSQLKRAIKLYKEFTAIT